MRTLTDLIFLPRPQRIGAAEGVFRFDAGAGIRIRGDSDSLREIAGRLQAEIRLMKEISCTIRADYQGSREGPEIDLTLVESGTAQIPPQGYRLTVSPTGIGLSAGDSAGLFHGVTTVAQIFRQCGAHIPCGVIDDWPDFPIRGVMLDISRDKVPTMETLFSLVDLLSNLKINHFQLYTEHTFAYRNHGDVWHGCSPMTAEEMRELDAYCRRRFIELAPNQNSFGHLQRWLSLPRYKRLAECPDGFDWPWGGRSTLPFSLDPSNPQSLALLEELYDELLPNFKSPLFNVGCDETFDLGQGRNKERCARLGKGRVYLDFLLKIHELVKSRGRTMLFWGDIAMQHPDLIPEISSDAIALEWGYEAEHPFAEHAARFAAAKVPFYVCPGTSSWNSIAGRTDNCLENLRCAAEAGLAHGAAGYLITDWGDNGHWQVLPVSFLGYAAGAAMSWCTASNSRLQFAEALDVNVFQDRAQVMGGLAMDLGNAYLHVGTRYHNMTALFRLLHDPGASGLPQTVTEETLEKTLRFIESAASPIDRARMQRPDGPLIRDEYANTVKLLIHSCERGLALRRGTESERETRERFSSDLKGILVEYRRLWLKRNRIGGLDDSIKGLERLNDETLS